MSDTQPQEKQAARWMVALVCSALTLLLAFGGVFALRDQLLADVRAENKEQKRERDKLSSRVDTVQTTLDNISSQPKSDATALASLSTKLDETAGAIEVLNARIDTLEKQLAEVKAAPAPTPATAEALAPAAKSAAEETPAETKSHTELTSMKLAVHSGQPFANELTAWLKLYPDAEKQVTNLSDVAATGVVSEVELSRSLLATLDAIPEATTTIDDSSFVGKINAHLKGLVHIKKSSGVDPYASLRKEALHEDVATLTRSVERLNDDDRAPLEDWLKRAKQRRAALDELDALTAEDKR